MSKILIFSDSHLSPRFNQAYFNKLANLIEQADQVIINGDFWEGYFYSFDEFLNSNKLNFDLPKIENIFESTLELCFNQDDVSFTNVIHACYDTKEKRY